MLKARAPRITEETFKDADNLGTDIRLSGRVTELKWVEGDRIGSVGRVEVDDVIDTMLGNEAEVVDCEVAVRVDDTVALIVKNITESEKF